MVRTPTALLIDAARGRRSGRLSWNARGNREIVLALRHGRIVQVLGLGLLDAYATRGIELHGDLAKDLPAVVAAGVPLQEAYATAAGAVGQELAGSASGKASRVQFVEEAVDAALPLEADILDIVRRGFAEVRPAEKVARSLERRMSERVSAEGRPAGLGPWMMRVHAACQKGPKLVELAAENGQPGTAAYERFWLSLDLLMEMGLVQLGGGSSVVRRDADHEKQRLESLLRRIQEIRRLPAIEALGQGPDPDLELDADGVDSLFRSAAGPYHPDQYMDEPGRVQRVAAHVFALLNERREELLDEPGFLNLEVERLRCLGRGERWVTEDMRKHARVLFREAQGLESRKHWASAREKVERAIELDPNETIFEVQRAFLRVVLQEITPAEGVRDIDALDLASVGARVEAAFRTGRLLRMAGQPQKAIERFDRVLQMAPDHVGAQREARLLRQRSGGRPG